MAADLTGILRLGAICLATGFVGPVSGQELTDPTRPPDAIRPPPGSAAAEPAAPRFASLPVVILSADRRQVTINGQTANLGGRIGGAKVTKISDSEVVLQSADSTETIRLYGAVEKKLLKPLPEVTKGTRQAPPETGK